MKQYRKKPVIVKAAQWLGNKQSWDEVMSIGNIDWSPGEMGSNSFYINTPEGTMTATKGDYIIKGVNGEFYPCKPEIFIKTYDQVDASVKCTAPQDPNHVLTADEIKRLAETGSLCDCMKVVDYGEREHPIKEGDHVDFGTALHLMELGERVQRAGWNGKGMFVYQVPAASYPAQRNAKGVLVGDYPEDMVPYAAYLALKTVSGEVVPWTISQSDALATDWMLHAIEISEPQHMTDEQVKNLVNEGIVITSDCFELDGNEYFGIDMALSLIESDEIACQRADSGVVLTIEDVTANDWQIVDTPKPSHVTRLNIEVNQVQDRLDKLSKFLLKGKPAITTADDLNLLQEQWEHMTAYRDVLVKRANLANRH